MRSVKSIKYSFFSLCILALACHNKPVKTGIATTPDSPVYYPYHAIYTEEFEKGKSAQTRIVLEIWKEIENGDFSNQSDKFSDSLKIILPDEILEGNKAEVLNKMKKRRSRYSDVQCYLDAWMPVKAKDTGEDLVFIWGRQDCTIEKGKRDYLVLHEIWRFDRNGKIRQMDQYLTHPH